MFLRMRDDSGHVYTQFMKSAPGLNFKIDVRAKLEHSVIVSLVIKKVTTNQKDRSFVQRYL